MVESPANYLKLYKEEPPEPACPRLEDLGNVTKVLQAFELATGWSFQYLSGLHKPTGLTWSAPVNPGDGMTPGHLRLHPVGAPPALDEQSARRCGSAIADMLGELQRTRHALWQREAELAAGIPLVPHHDEKGHLAARLEAVLRSGAEAVGCDAAAVYLLDDATTSLKLRSCWGLPWDRFADAPRPLDGSLADLEAMLGHVVVLDDIDVLCQWNAPEQFPAAVCVPLSSPTTILGTVWFFSRSRRDFRDQQTNILETVAGRIAGDLEREILLREGVAGAELKRQLAAAERTQRNQLPTIPPLLDGWDIAGWTTQAGGLGGDFFDWFALPDGLVAVAIGDVMDQGIEAAISASTVKAALRSHGQYHRRADGLLNQVNITLWTGSAGDQYASVLCGLVDTVSGRVRYAAAGDLSVVHIGKDGWNSLGQRTARLGESPESVYHEREVQLHPGQCLVLFTDGFRDAVNKAGQPLNEAGVCERLTDLLHLPANELLLACKDRFESHAANPNDDDRTVLVVKRSDP